MLIECVLFFVLWCLCRLFIHEQGFDDRIYSTYEKQAQIQLQAQLQRQEEEGTWKPRHDWDTEDKDEHLMIMYTKERGTWGYAFPIMTTLLQRLINWPRLGSIDAYIRYIADLTSIAIPIENVQVGTNG